MLIQHVHVPLMNSSTLNIYLGGNTASATHVHVHVLLLLSLFPLSTFALLCKMNIAMLVLSHINIYIYTNVVFYMYMYCCTVVLTFTCTVVLYWVDTVYVLLLLFYCTCMRTCEANSINACTLYMYMYIYKHGSLFLL